MRVCIPTSENRGQQSVACGHFGSAPYFVVFDTDTRQTESINNGALHREHGACLPTAILGGERVDAVVVGGIGGRALDRLSRMGIKAYKSMGGTVAENLSALQAGKLSEMSSQHACSGHGHHDV